jgi:NAD(P)H-dependent flavin oxidoreductase YrpB (nitropropane dioxygenase family)
MLLRGLDVELPVLAAPMAGGPGSPELVLAAAHAGSLGFLAGGYKSSDALGAEIATLKASGLPFAVNLFAPNPLPVEGRAFTTYAREIQADAEAHGVELAAQPREDDDEWRAKLELLLADPVPLVSFTFGVPDAHALAALRDAGSLLVQTITSVPEATAASELGFHALVVQAHTAGGHWGTLTPSRPPARLELAELLAQVRSATPLPLIGAGGIGTPADVSAALAAGADAVAVGTSLLLADEAATTPTHRSALAGARETVPTRAFTGRPARGLQNGFIARHEAQAPLGYPAIHYLTSPLRKAAAAAGDPERLHLWAGTGYRQARPEPVAATLDRLAEGL